MANYFNNRNNSNVNVDGNNVDQTIAIHMTSGETLERSHAPGNGGTAPGAAAPVAEHTMVHVLDQGFSLDARSPGRAAHVYERSPDAGGRQEMVIQELRSSRRAK